MDGYADAYLAVGAPLGADAVTLSPYLGFGALASAIRTADDAGRGVFVLARTSNPEGARRAARRPGRAGPWRRGSSTPRRRRTATPWPPRPPASRRATGAVELGDGCGRRDSRRWARWASSSGATAEHGLDLSALSGAVLAPGLGAQGAAPADLAARFAGVRGVVLPAASRSVLAAGPDPAALRAAAVALRDELAAATRPPH